MKTKTWKTEWVVETQTRIAAGQQIARQLGPPKMTHAEVAKQLGISRQTVIRLEALALEKVARQLRLAVKLAMP